MTKGIDIRVSSFGNVERAERLLSGVKGGATTALVRALNRASESGRTAAVRETTTRYTIKAKDIRPSIKLEKASKTNLTAGISSKGPRIPLSAYLHKPKTDTTGAKRRPVYVSVKKGSLKPLGQGFIWKGDVMQRVGKERHKITRRTGPALPMLLNNEEVVEKIMNTMNETTDKRLDHEINRLLEKQK